MELREQRQRETEALQFRKQDAAFTARLRAATNEATNRGLSACAESQAPNGPDKVSR